MLKALIINIIIIVKLIIKVFCVFIQKPYLYSSHYCLNRLNRTLSYYLFKALEIEYYIFKLIFC